MLLPCQFHNRKQAEPSVCRSANSVPVFSFAERALAGITRRSCVHDFCGIGSGPGSFPNQVLHANFLSFFEAMMPHN